MIGSWINSMQPLVVERNIKKPAWQQRGAKATQLSITAPHQIVNILTGTYFMGSFKFQCVWEAMTLVLIVQLDLGFQELKCSSCMIYDTASGHAMLFMHRSRGASARYVAH